MKVLMFTPYFQKEYGSHEYYLVKHLTRLGHEVVLVTSKHPYPKYNQDYKKIILDDEIFEAARIIRLDSSLNVKGVPFLKNIENVIVDEVSIEYLRGSTVDYVEDIMGNGFKVDNPNAAASCGCGSSFRTQDGEAPQNSAGGCSGCG